MITLLSEDTARIHRAAQSIARKLPPSALLDTDDLANECVVRVLQGRKSITGPMLDLLRRNGWMKHCRNGESTPQRLSLGLEDMEELSIPEPSTDRVDVDHMLAGVTALQRQAITLRYLEGMTETEAARALAIPVNRFRSRLYEGLKSIRRKL